MITSFEGYEPAIAESSFIHPSADVIGHVTIGSGCWIGPGARIRGDYGRITIGDATSVEDNCVIHARPDDETSIGSWVTLGHGAIVHNATIKDWAVVGMGSIVSDWSTVGEWAVVGEGAVVRRRQMVEDGTIVVGVPARALERPVDDAFKAKWARFKSVYVDLAGRYRAEFARTPEGPTGANLKPLDPSRDPSLLGPCPGYVNASVSVPESSSCT